MSTVSLSLSLSLAVGVSRKASKASTVSIATMQEHVDDVPDPYWDGEHVLKQLEALRRAKRQAEEDPCCDADDVASLTRTMTVLIDEYTRNKHMLR